MDRREFVLGAAAGLVSLGATGLAQASGTQHHHDNHKKHAGGARLTKVRETSADCQSAAADCARHCITLLGTGDTSLADCLSSVRRMEAVVGAMNSVAGSESTPSSRSRELAQVCAAYCRDCARDCEPHANMHSECKVCLDACRNCAEACDALAA